MLTVAECRAYLDSETAAALSDKELERIRDDFYKLARIILAAKRGEGSNENEYGK